MKHNEQSKEYNKWAKEFDFNACVLNAQSASTLYSMIDCDLKNKKLLDLACGSGMDLVYYVNQQGADGYGVDSSDEQVKIAQSKLGEERILLSDADNLPFKNNQFDIVTSKYAIQAMPNVEDVYKEVVRVLKPKGKFIFLVTHPMRHYMEKTEKPRDYFKKELVTSWIFNKTLPLTEWSHTMNDYLSPYFFKHFELEAFIEKEEVDGCSEWIDGEKYPGFFVIRATKK